MLRFSWAQSMRVSSSRLKLPMIAPVQRYSKTSAAGSHIPLHRRLAQNRYLSFGCSRLIMLPKSSQQSVGRKKQRVNSIPPSWSLVPQRTTSREARTHGSVRKITKHVLSTTLLQESCSVLTIALPSIAWVTLVRIRRQLGISP